MLFSPLGGEGFGFPIEALAARTASIVQASRHQGIRASGHYLGHWGTRTLGH